MTEIRQVPARIVHDNECEQRLLRVLINRSEKRLAELVETRKTIAIRPPTKPGAKSKTPSLVHGVPRPKPPWTFPEVETAAPSSPPEAVALGSPQPDTVETNSDPVEPIEAMAPVETLVDVDAGKTVDANGVPAEYNDWLTKPKGD